MRAKTLKEMAINWLSNIYKEEGNLSLIHIYLFSPFRKFRVKASPHFDQRFLSLDFQSVHVPVPLSLPCLLYTSCNTTGGRKKDTGYLLHIRSHIKCYFSYLKALASGKLQKDGYNSLYVLSLIHIFGCKNTKNIAHNREVAYLEDVQIKSI